MSKGRVLFVSTNDWTHWGGSEELWGAAATRMAQDGWDVSAEVKWHGMEISQVGELRKVGVRIEYRTIPRPAWRAVRRLVLGDGISRDMRRLAQFDLVVMSLGTHVEGVHWMTACRKAGVPYAVVVQAAAECWWPGDDEGERLAAGFQGAAANYFVSEANRELVERQLAVDLPNAQVVRNPFNVPYHASPSWPGGEEASLRFACVGRLSPMAKGQDLILEVLRDQRWRHRDVTVSFVGNGANTRGLKRQCERYGLSSVRFVGFVSDVETVWRNHHALLLPSRLEGLPLALVEAMLCWRAAVVTDVAGHREVITDGVNGFLAKAPTVELLNDAMERAWSNRRHLAEMGKHAGECIRALVPADPGAQFVTRLECLIASNRGSHPTELAGV